MVVCVLWEHVAWVRFPALRQSKKQPIGLFLNFCWESNQRRGLGKREFPRSGGSERSECWNRWVPKRLAKRGEGSRSERRIPSTPTNQEI